MTSKEATVHLWCDGLVLDFGLNFYFKLDNFQITATQFYIENDKKIAFIVYNEKNYKPTHKIEKTVNIL